MGELREQMQHDLVVRGMSPRTQEADLAAVAGLAKHYHQRPDTLSTQQVEGYVRYLIEQRHLAPNSVRVAVFGVQFFSTVTLKRPGFALPLPKGVKKLPEVLSREEVARLLAKTATVRERALLMATYGGGYASVRWCGCGAVISPRRGTSSGWRRARGARIATPC